jgi:hypothetical protein
MRLRELRRIQAEVGNGLLVELPARRQLLALLELLYSALSLATPASVSRTRIEPVLAERLLNLSDFASRQVVRRDRLAVFSGLLLTILLTLLVLSILFALVLGLAVLPALILVFHLLTLRLLLIGVGRSEGSGRAEHGGRQQSNCELSHDMSSLWVHYILINAHERTPLPERVSARDENAVTLAGGT